MLLSLFFGEIILFFLKRERETRRGVAVLTIESKHCDEVAVLDLEQRVMQDADVRGGDDS